MNLFEINIFIANVTINQASSHCICCKNGSYKLTGNFDNYQDNIKHFWSRLFYYIYEFNGCCWTLNTTILQGTISWLVGYNKVFFKTNTYFPKVMDLFLEKSYAQSNNIANQCINQYVVTSRRTVYLQNKQRNQKVNVMNISSNHWKWDFFEHLPGYITTNHELGGGGLENVVVYFLKILPPKKYQQYHAYYKRFQWDKNTFHILRLLLVSSSGIMWKRKKVEFKITS